MSKITYPTMENEIPWQVFLWSSPQMDKIYHTWKVVLQGSMLITISMEGNLDFQWKGPHCGHFNYHGRFFYGQAHRWITFTTLGNWFCREACKSQFLWKEIQISNGKDHIVVTLITMAGFL